MFRMPHAGRGWKAQTSKQTTNDLRGKQITISTSLKHIKTTRAPNIDPNLHRACQLFISFPYITLLKGNVGSLKWQHDAKALGCSTIAIGQHFSQHGILHTKWVATNAGMLIDTKGTNPILPLQWTLVTSGIWWDGIPDSLDWNKAYH